MEVDDLERQFNMLNSQISQARNQLRGNDNSTTGYDSRSIGDNTAGGHNGYRGRSSSGNRFDKRSFSGQSDNKQKWISANRKPGRDRSNSGRSINTINRLNGTNSDVDSAGDFLSSDVQDQYDNYDSDLNVKGKNTFSPPSNVKRHMKSSNAQRLKDFYR